MTRIANSPSKPRRLAAVIAALALAGVLSGCVVYPAGPGYGYHYHYDRGYWH
jgi:hypothetical protein